MFCPSCSKLALLSTKRICMRCGLSIFNNLSVICDKCSSDSKVCSICLKKIGIKKQHGGCNGCGAK